MIRTIVILTGSIYFIPTSRVKSARAFQCLSHTTSTKRHSTQYHGMNPDCREPTDRTEWCYFNLIGVMLWSILHRPQICMLCDHITSGDHGGAPFKLHYTPISLKFPWLTSSIQQPWELPRQIKNLTASRQRETATSIHPSQTTRKTARTTMHTIKALHQAQVRDMTPIPHRTPLRRCFLSIRSIPCCKERWRWSTSQSTALG